MADTLKLTILSPERRLATAVAAASVTLNGSEGQIQILPGHAPMLGTLETGAFSYEKAGGGSGGLGVISNGFFEITSDRVMVLAETLELRGEIDVARAKLAQQRAEKALQEAGIDEHRFRKYQLKLQRALIRQHLGSQSEQ